MFTRVQHGKMGCVVDLARVKKVLQNVFVVSLATLAYAPSLVIARRLILFAFLLA